MNYKSKTIIIALGVIIAILLVVLLYRPAKIVKQFVQLEDTIKVQDVENDSVTVDIIKSHIWRLDRRSHIDQHYQHVWKLKSGNYVIHFNYMPHAIYFKYNPGEVIPQDLILQLLAIDEEIHETYNLHKIRQVYK